MEDLEGFWRSIWDYDGIESPTPFAAALGQDAMPGARWFDGARVNYARHVFRHVAAAEAAGQPAIVAMDESGDTVTLGWAELRRQAASLALELRARGIGPGDRVAGYLPNIPAVGHRAARLRQPWRDLDALLARHGDQRGPGPLAPDRAQGR